MDHEPFDTTWFPDDWPYLDAAILDRNKLIWSRSIQIVHVMNGDSLGLDCEAPGCDLNDPPVVYLDHETLGTDQISPRFSEFMLHWQELSFIGPEIWLLGHWLDRDSGRLNPALHKTAQLRKLLTPRKL